MKSRKAFPLRLDPLLYEALEAWAAGLRSVNGQIEYLLKQAVEKRTGKSLAPDESPAKKNSGTNAEPRDQDPDRRRRMNNPAVAAAEIAR